MTATIVQDRVDQDRPLVAEVEGVGVATTDPVALGVSPVDPTPSTPPANVVEWHQVADLPWRGAFDMVPLPAMVPVVERRRRVDTRTLADVVREVAA